jgi:hypothetical protein
MPRKPKDLNVDPGNMLDAAGRQGRGGRVGSPSARGYMGPRGQMPSGFGRVGSPSLGGYGAAKPPVADIDLADQDKFRTTGMNRGSITDTEPGLTIEDMLSMLSGSDGYGSDSGGGGGGSRGGGGGSYNPDPFNWRGIANYQNVQNAYQQMLDAQAAGASAVSGGFDARQKALDDMLAVENARNAGIQAGLVSSANQARSNVAGAYSAGSQGLQDLLARYQGMIAGRQPAAERSLQAFGAEGAVSSPAMLQDTMLAAQQALLQRGVSEDALLAQRPDMYAQLGAEQADSRQRQADLVRAQLLAQRQQAEAQAARERAQLALQMQQALLQAQG